MTHPHRLMLLSAGWLLAAMAAAVLAYAHPDSECPKCPVCPKVTTQPKAQIPAGAFGYPAGRKTAPPADTDPNTPVCLPKEYAVPKMEVNSFCQESYPKVQKWECTIDKEALWAYLGADTCAPGYEVKVSGENDVYGYLCVNGSNAEVTPTCGADGIFIPSKSVYKSSASSNPYYYFCKHKAPPPGWQADMCGPVATNVGSCCVVLPK